MTDSVRLPTEKPAALARIHDGNTHQSTETIRRTAVKSGVSEVSTLNHGQERAVQNRDLDDGGGHLEHGAGALLAAM
ncbi:MAG: hypothetical protein OXI26_05910 [bacterium]|nr:hypothetical protein [bacterium]